MGNISFWTRYKVDPANPVNVHTAAVADGRTVVLAPGGVRALPFNVGSVRGLVVVSIFGAEAGKDTALLAAWFSAAPNGAPFAGPHGIAQSSGINVGLGLTLHIDVGDSVPLPGGILGAMMGDPYFEQPVGASLVLNVATDYQGDIKVHIYPAASVA